MKSVTRLLRVVREGENPCVARDEGSERALEHGVVESVLMRGYLALRYYVTPYVCVYRYVFSVLVYVVSVLRTCKEI